MFLCLTACKYLRFKWLIITLIGQNHYHIVDFQKNIVKVCSHSVIDFFAIKGFHGISGSVDMERLRQSQQIPSRLLLAINKLYRVNSPLETLHCFKI